MKGRHVLVLFADEWDRAAIAHRNDGARYHLEGFDVHRFPDNARLFTFDALGFVRDLVRRYRRLGLAAVVSSDEQFGGPIATLVARELGLEHTPLQAILTAQHKYYARRALQEALPECNPRFAVLGRDFRRERKAPLPYPFYVKPVKATFSVLARRVDSWEELDRHLRFSWWEEKIIERLVKPFGDVMQAHTDFDIPAFSMLAEELLEGWQVTVNGFARAGRFEMLGVVDSVMYPGTDQFQRFQYPSRLAACWQEKVEAVAVRALQAIGFTHGLFNVELRVRTDTGAIRIIEINPRAARQFYDLFERVDGYNSFEAMISIAAGEEPAIRRRAGRDAVAASFVWRDLEGCGLGRWPSPGDIRGLKARHPDASIMVYPKRGADLAREIKWLGTYRYAVANIGAESLEALFAAYGRIAADIDFHPSVHAVPSIDEWLANAPGD